MKFKKNTALIIVLAIMVIAIALFLTIFKNSGNIQNAITDTSEPTLTEHVTANTDPIVETTIPSESTEPINDLIYFYPESHFPTVGDKVVTEKSRDAFKKYNTVTATIIDDYHELDKDDPRGNVIVTLDGSVVYGTRELRFILDSKQQKLKPDSNKFSDEDLSYGDPETWPAFVFLDEDGESYRLIDMNLTFSKDKPSKLMLMPDEAYSYMASSFVEDMYYDFNDYKKVSICGVKRFYYDENVGAISMDFSIGFDGQDATGTEVQIFNSSGDVVYEQSFDTLKTAASFNLDYQEDLFVRFRLFKEKDGQKLYSYYSESEQIQPLKEGANPN